MQASWDMNGYFCYNLIKCLDYLIILSSTVSRSRNSAEIQ